MAGIKVFQGPLEEELQLASGNVDGILHGSENLFLDFGKRPIVQVATDFDHRFVIQRLIVNDIVSHREHDGENPIPAPGAHQDFTLLRFHE